MGFSWGHTVVLRRGAVSYERGTPVCRLFIMSKGPLYCWLFLLSEEPLYWLLLMSEVPLCWLFLMSEVPLQVRKLFASLAEQHCVAAGTPLHLSLLNLNPAFRTLNPQS